MEGKNQANLTDTHAHLASEKFRGERDAIVARAAEAGVDRIVTIACDLEDSETNLELARTYPGVAPTVGIHPLYVGEIAEDDWPGTLAGLAKTPPVAAIGEIGLDYYHPPADGSDEATWRARQWEVFERQLQLALELDMPVVVHQRDSAEDVTAMLRQFPDVRAVLHCFSGTVAQAEEALEMGNFISFTGILTFPSAEEVRRAAAVAPIDRVMVETDCPYLAPAPHRGKRCEPAMVVHTAQRLAEIHGMDPEETAEVTSRNATAFFRSLPQPESRPDPTS